MAEKPHLDIYVNGVFKDCASTGGNFVTQNPGNTIGIGRLEYDLDGLSNTPTLDGVIDEVRFWTVARTASQIQTCMSQELGIEGDCQIDSSLKGHWRFNEGSGTSVYDFSGNGYSGTIQSPVRATANLWDGGWVSSYHFKIHI